MPPKIQELFHKHFQNNGRDFVLLILYTSENGFTDKDIIRSYEALRLWRSADQIKAFMHATNEPENNMKKSVFVAEYTGQSHQIEDGAMNILLDLTRMMENTTALNEVNHLN